MNETIILGKMRIFHWIFNDFLIISYISWMTNALNGVSVKLAVSLVVVY